MDGPNFHDQSRNDPSIQAFHQKARRDMTTGYRNAQDAAIEAARALVNFNARAASGEVPEGFVSRERARLVAAVRVADETALNAFREDATRRQDEASKLRLRASIIADPTARLADVAERQALAASGTNAASFLTQASQMLAAGQPERAKFLASVAAAMGARDFTGGLDRAIEHALDQAVPDRQRAREIEDDIDRDGREFTADRFRILAAAGVGIRADGAAGTGAPGEHGSANMAAKAFDYLDKTARGEWHGAPVGDASNTSNENADLIRAANPRMASQDAFEHGLVGAEGGDA